MTDLSIKKIVAVKNNLEQILDNLSEGIIAHDLNRRIFFFNREAEKITGYSREEILGKDCHEVFGNPLCGERCSFCDQKTILDDHDEYPINIVSKSGESKRIDMSVTLIRDESDTYVGVLASLKDVTDLLDLRIRAGKLTSFSNMIGRDNKMIHVFQQIIDVAGYDYPVHISGETGTGKEMVAAAVHGESHRSGGPFVPINCGALPEGLIESELFGHVRGAFTGADRDKMGLFAAAEGGTIFLDEIGELSFSLQVKLLRVLQEKEIQPVGSSKPQKMDVRIIAATAKNLEREVQNGTFREDLFYRLNVVYLVMPPLRERSEDILPLSAHFIKIFNNRM